MRETERNWITEIIWTILFGVAGLVAAALWIGNRKEAADGWETAAKLLPLLFILAAAAVLKRWKSLKFSKKNWHIIFTKGWYIFLAGMILAGLFLLSAPTETYRYFSFSALGLFMAGCTLTAVFEEIMCRGLIQNILCERMKDPWHAMVISSAIFALLHFLNLVGKPYFLVGTTVQVLYTFALGTLFAVSYDKSKNLWVPVILHAIFNMLGSIGDIFLVPNSGAGAAVEADLSVSGAILQLVIILPGIYFAYKGQRK